MGACFDLSSIKPIKALCFLKKSVIPPKFCESYLRRAYSFANLRFQNMVEYLTISKSKIS